jgi:PqqD family protein of HPr-rel-A system
VNFELVLSSPLAYQCWGEECVLFNPESGDTHLLAVFGIQVLERLACGPASIKSLAEFFADGADATYVWQITGHLEHLMADFERLALVMSRTS